MEIIISVAAKVAEYTVAPIGRQVGYLIYYKDNFKELKDQMKELERAKERIKHDIEVEKRNGKEIESDVQNWLIKVDKIIEAANKLSEDPCHAIVECSRWHCPDLKLRHQLSRNAKKIARDVVKVQGKGQFDRVGYYLPPLDGGFTSARRGIEKLKSRKAVKVDILLALRDPKVSKVGIYGLAGVGKTTIVKEVVRQVIDDKLFDAVIMAHVSPNPNLERIQYEIADFLGLYFEEKSIAGRARRLCERIKMEKTILIVLDDIWVVFDLEELGIPLEDNHNGCKLLLTSRNQDILQKMDTQKDMRLEVLNEEETWTLFEDMASDASKDASLQNIATQVANKCKGLPLLIVTVARALRNKDIYYWKDALNQLERVDNGEINKTVYLALEFSYNQLGGDELKAVFLLCGLLESNCKVEHMLKCVMGLGILKHINTVEDARIRLFILINSLKASCLLLEDNTNEQVKMHDIVREVAISIAERDQHVVLKIERGLEEMEWPSNDLLQRSPYIILKRRFAPKLPERLDCPKVKLFCSYNEYHQFGILPVSFFEGMGILKVFPDSFFEGMGNLKVLTLTCLYLSSLPTSFRFLINLRTLCLDECKLGDMIDIGALKNLQILSLCGSRFMGRILPSAIRQLTSLRMLDSSNSGIEVIPPNIISNLTKLEELYLGNNPIKWEVGSSNEQNRNASLAELKHLPNLTALEIQIQEAWILPRDLMFEKLQRYKIVIGDKWTSEHGASRLLKLKLDTSIYLEHGIKALIKRVEDLYLDEINGISNVLFHLNGEGFPLLKHLHIQNNANVHYIIDSKGRNLTCVSFPNLETLALHNLNKLEKICHGPLKVNSFAKLRIIKVESCGQLEYLFSIPIVKELSQLFEIEVYKCSAMKNIVSMERMDNNIPVQKIEFISLHSLTLQHLPTIENFCSCDFFESSIRSFFNVKVAFPNLETLELCSINLHQIWDDDKLFETHSLQNLANLTVKDCGGLKYLFSPFMIKSFKNLKRLEIRECHMMEEIITTQGRNRMATSDDEVRLFKLEKIIVSDMKNLKTVWHNQFEGLKTLEVKKCEKLENIFQSCYVQKALRSLETLEVHYCPLMEEIFKLNANHGILREEDTTHLKNLILDGLPKMKQVWSRDPHGALRFFNLQVVQVKECENLDYLFPFSIAKDLPQLEDLKVDSCGIKEVVAKKDGAMEGTVTFELNHLTSLVFRLLHKLRVFYPGLHTLECRSLIELQVSNCNKMMVFNMQSQESSPLHKFHYPMQQPLIADEQVIPNLKYFNVTNAASRLQLHEKCLSVFGFANEEASFPNWMLRNVSHLETLIVHESSFKKIFEDERYAPEKIEIKSRTIRLKYLTLNKLPQLQHICKEGFQIDPLLELLESITINECCSLKNLLPSYVSFNNLTELEVAKCNGLITLITSSTARGLVKLKSMEIRECNSLEQVVAEEEGGTQEEIVFSNLEVLELQCLRRLIMFCSSKCLLKFPLLKEIVMEQCPKMKFFSKSQISTNPTFRHLELQESNVLLSGNILQALSNLEKLEVRECDSLEAVFDLGGISNKGTLVKQTIPLKEITLSNLAKLKHIWKYDSQEIVTSRNSGDDDGGDDYDGLKMSQPRGTESKGEKLKQSSIALDPRKMLCFCCLHVVTVEDCEDLEYLFPFSIAMDLQYLEKVKVRRCGIKEIFAKRSEGPMDGNFTIVFNRLKFLELGNLHKLERVYAGSYSLACQSLETIHVYNCHVEFLWTVQSTSSTKRGVRDSEISMAMSSMRQFLFGVEEVISKLQRLKVNNATNKILFNKSQKLLWVYDFLCEEFAFPDWLLQNLSNLETLDVRGSSFKKIFQDKRQNRSSTTRIKYLTLKSLPQLQHICKEGSQIDPTLEHLESITVIECSSLINLVPSPVSFKHLTSLKVAKCSGLITLITSSTAKSLVELKTMKICECNSLEQIVMQKRDGSNEDIAFSSLEILELESLPRLIRFCSSKCFLKFPLLKRIVVKQCPRMKVFSESEMSTPKLQKVLVEEKDEESCWEGDLNKTIKKMFLDKVAFRSFQHLRLSEYPELKELWYNHNGNKTFCHLKILVVYKCDFLSEVLFSSNLLQLLHTLEELHVIECDSLKSVFDAKVMDDKEIRVKETSKLRELYLSDLPNLKQIWNKEVQETVRFGNLQVVDVVACQSLTHLFSILQCQDLGQLEELRIEHCGVQEIVGIEEESEEIRFDFSQLTELRLQSLTELKSFYPGRHTLNCPQLMILDVCLCEALQIFAFDYLDSQHIDEVDMPTKQALFHVVKVSPNLEELALNKDDAMMILNRNYKANDNSARMILNGNMANLFYNIELLRLQCFQETPSMFLIDFLERFPNTVTLQVRYSSFETLFPSKGIGHIGFKSPTKIRNLWLFELKQLQYIWDDEFEPDALIENLEVLSVVDCSTLRRLAPPSISFKNLTKLGVKYCKGLIYLMTSSTAKSLVHLKALKVDNCEMIENVVMIEEGELEEEITFASLKYLQMTSLPSFKSFCSQKCIFIFPSLVRLIVTGCPKMQHFSTEVTIAPKLMAVDVENGKEHWKKDLNTTIKQLFMDKKAPSSSRKS